MENVEEATELISYSHRNPVSFNGRDATFSFSKSQSINQNVIASRKTIHTIHITYNRL